VNTHRVEKSVGHENTFAVDVSDLTVLRRELLDQSERVAVRLRAAGYSARTIALKLRFADFTTISRSRTLPEATSVARRIYEQAVELLEEQDFGGRRIRLIGVRAEQLVDGDGDGLSLWSEDDAWRDAEQVMDKARERFGRGTIRPATLLPRKKDEERPTFNRET
jgi:DNA polymerase-4